MKGRLVFAALFIACSGICAENSAETKIEPPRLDVVTRWVNPTRVGARWEMRPHERTRPVAVGDILYFGNLSGEVYAVHRTDGYLLWKTKLPGSIEGALTYARSKIYVGDTQGNFVALNARDGSEAWRFKIQGEWLSPPSVLRDKVFAASSSDELYALNEVSGKEIWHYSHRGDEKMTVRGTSGPTVFGSEVFQGFSDGYLVGLSANAGKVLWEKKLRHKDRFYDVDMAPFVDEHSVLAATFDGRLYSLDRLTGETKWMFPVGSYGGFLVENDTIYFSGLNGEVHALERGSGAVKWKSALEEGIGLTPALVGSHIVVTTSSDPIYVLDAKDGKTVWKGRLGAGTLASAAGSGTDGWFYCLSNFGILYSFELVPGATVPPNRGPKTLQTPSAIQRNRVERRDDNPITT